MSNEPLLLACRRLVRRRPSSRGEALAALDDCRALLDGLTAVRADLARDLARLRRAAVATNAYRSPRSKRP
jgi:hypothetical protein